MNGADHTAAASASGYLFQVEWALLELAKRSRTGSQLAVSLEILDDVSFYENGQPVEVDQLKLRESGDLTDMSSDLWKSIGVWVDLIENLDEDRLPILALVTTALAPDESAAAHLREGSQDANEAERRLVDAAKQSTNLETEVARKRFLGEAVGDRSGLTSAQRRRLVEAVVVRDQASPIEDLGDQLVEAMWQLAHRDPKRFLDELRGWWYGLAIQLLRAERDPVLSEELIAKADAIRDTLIPGVLPPDAADLEIDEAIIEDHKEKTFVVQLDLVDINLEVNTRLLTEAIRNYYRAYTQRSNWLRDQLIGLGDLEDYERKLKEEWDRAYGFMLADLPSEASEEAKRKAGRRLLQQVVDNSKACLGSFREPYWTAGRFHHLADKPDIGWHPEFEDRLASLLTAGA